MSRSFLHTPICGITLAASEKDDKKRWHSLFRATEKINLAQCVDWDEFLTTDERDVSSVWTFAKDGRQYFGHSRHPERHKWMRK